MARRAIRRKPHHFVFIAVMRKSEVLSDCLVEDAERMRKQHAFGDMKIRSSSHSPGCTREVAEAVDGNRKGFGISRAVVRRCKVAFMMLHVRDARAQPIRAESAREMTG